MAKSYSFVYFGDAKVSRASKLYKVELDEEETAIFLQQDLVDTLSKKAENDENLIAILLAYVEYVRKSRATSNKNPRPLDDRILIEGFAILLTAISIEELISKIKSMKWHEIVYVLSAKSPIEEIENL